MSLQKLVNEVCAVNAIFTVGLRKQWIKQIAGKKDFPDISQFCMCHNSACDNSNLELDILIDEVT